MSSVASVHRRAPLVRDSTAARMTLVRMAVNPPGTSVGIHGAQSISERGFIALQFSMSTFAFRDRRRTFSEPQSAQQAPPHPPTEFVPVQHGRRLLIQFFPAQPRQCGLVCVAASPAQVTANVAVAEDQ